MSGGHDFTVVDDYAAHFAGTRCLKTDPRLLDRESHESLVFVGLHVPGFCLNVYGSLCGISASIPSTRLTTSY